MRFLDNVLQDYIDRAEPGMERAAYSRDARALGRPRRDGLPLLPAGARPAVRGRDGEVVEHADVQAHQARRPTRPRCSWRSSAAPAPTPPTCGVMERFSCKMAIAPTASISIICGGTSACIEPIPANIYTHKTLSGSFSVKNPYLEKLLNEKSKNTRRGVELDPRARRLGPAPRLPVSQEEKDCYKTSFEIDQRWLIELAGRPHALHRPGAVAEPVHPGRRREVGPADAPLPRLGAGHQVALLPALQVGAARRASRAAASRPTTRSTAPKFEIGETTDYDECLACQ